MCARLAGLQASGELPNSASLFPVRCAGISEVCALRLELGVGFGILTQVILAQACTSFTH